MPLFCISIHLFLQKYMNGTTINRPYIKQVSKYLDLLFKKKRKLTADSTFYNNVLDINVLFYACPITAYIFKKHPIMLKNFADQVLV